ncbi:hypothetical protein RvY_14856 [Ramazzottius varieornatus]|uniref:Peptidase M12A domain-containing protein n=1 Tax=Ramazzottius varieornatus TaxID=947166 RepID=A0A1D1VSP4_RAMVA|nr:hypothetical protein RvY_14856 [Ramazzottius varieornatus]
MIAGLLSLSLLLLAVSCTYATINIQAQFLRWPYPTAIPYYLDAAYTADERTQIKAAIAKVVADMKSCIGFAEVFPTDPSYKVKITPFADDGTTAEPYCYSYPGFYKDLQVSGKTEQRVVLARGPTGCFTGKLRDLMKFVVVTIGKRNEHQRGDRGDYIDVKQDALAANAYSGTAYRIYSAQEAYWAAFPYDYCSITHSRSTDMAKPGQQAFTVKKAPFFVPALDRLSNSDCQLISLMYPTSCDRKKCDPLDCAAQVNTTTTVTPATATPTLGSTTAASTTGVTANTQGNTPTACPSGITAATATTTAGTTAPPFVKSTCTDGDFSTFCKKAPTASLLYEAGATREQDVYVLINGNCAMTYTMGKKAAPDDPGQTVATVDPALATGQTANPVDLSVLFPRYDSLGQTLPINFAFVASNNGPTFLSNSADPTKAAACSYPPNQPATPCYQATWSTPPLAGTLSTSFPPDSTTTVLTKDQFIVYHNSSKQLCISYTGQPTQANQPLCSTLTKELDPMVKVTAIQSVNDPDSPLLLLFGEDASGSHVIVAGDGLSLGSSFDSYGGAYPAKTYTADRMHC